MEINGRECVIGNTIHILTHISRGLKNAKSSSR